MALDIKIEQILNSLGPKGLRYIIDMGEVENFRNYMMQKFNWFRGAIVPHSDQHKQERAWYRFYIDHGRLPEQITFLSIRDEVLTEEDVKQIMDDIAAAYKNQYDFDVLNQHDNEGLIHKTLMLKGF